MTGASRSHVEVDAPTAGRQKNGEAATWPAGVGKPAYIGLPSGGRSNLAGALGFDANIVGGAFVAAQRANSIGSCTNRPCRLGQRCLACAACRPRCCWRSNTRAHHVTHRRRRVPSKAALNVGAAVGLAVGGPANATATVTTNTAATATATSTTTTSARGNREGDRTKALTIYQHALF